MLMAKFEIVFLIYIFTFLKSEIHHYFVNLFKASGRSIEENFDRPAGLLFR